MADQITKLGSGLENHENGAPIERIAKDSEGKEILETKSNVSEGVNVLSESAAEEGGVFSEDEKKVKAQSIQGTSGTTAAGQIHASVKQLPPVDTMIRETVEAIEAELKRTEDEVRVLCRNKNSSPYVLNDKVKQMRFLNSLLSQLKRAAKVAEEFVIGLWKQFVSKS